jgi:hypothetical protein
MRIPTSLRLLAALVLLVAPASARAQFAVYTDLAAFLAATSGAVTDSFDDLPAGAVLTSPLARSAGAFGYTVSTNTTELFAVGAGGDGWLSANTATDVVTFAGFGPRVRGVGGFFFGTDALGDVRSAARLTVRATDGAGTTTRSLVGAMPGTFLGFVSVGPLASLSIEVAEQPADLTWPTVDDLVLAEAAAVNVVPEPATVVGLGTGLAVLALVSRRRRAR